MIAHFIASEIWSDVVGMRYCSYRVANGLPSRSVRVVTRGGGSSARLDDIDSTVSLA